MTNYETIEPAESAEYEEDNFAEEHALSEYAGKVRGLFDEFLKNPTLEGAKALAESVGFFSDWYKDVNGVRPRWYWERQFACFSCEHKRLYEQATRA